MNRPHPWRNLAAPLGALQDELGRIYAHYRRGDPLGPTPEPTPTAEAASWAPPIDLVDRGDALVLWADLPGVDPSSIELAVTGAVLTLRGERPAPGALHQAHAVERRFGPFFRRVPLPGPVDVEAITAAAHDGVLCVSLPKVAAARPRTIPIGDAGRGMRDAEQEE